MIRFSGVFKICPDHRDYSFHRTFGGTTEFTPCNYDAGFPIPDQDADGLPYGCTGYSSGNLCQDEDKVQYYPKFTYDQTLAEEGIFPDNPNFEKVGCDVRDSLASTIVYGAQKVGETPAEALNHRRGQYFAVDLVAGMDWFDSFRSVLQQNKRSISFASPWYSSFGTPQNGIISAPNSYDTTFASWHNHVIVGWKTINGVDYLIDKSWQGTAYGDNGFVYFPREVVNSLMAISGSGAFTVIPFTVANIQTVQLELWTYLASYLRMILAKL